jgi:hypothetical protein
MKEKRRSRSNMGIDHCGRHANDWLFGGFSVRETAGKVVSKVSGSRRDTGEGEER